MIIQNWKDIYLELCELLKSKVEAIKWLDLWHNQISFLSTEHPFPAPAVFLDFNSQKMDDLGVDVQHVTLQVTVYLYYETFADTFKGSYNQESALAFLDILTEINKVLHASSGKHFGEMRRTAFLPVDTGDAGNTYKLVYVCNCVDYSASKEDVNSTDDNEYSDEFSDEFGSETAPLFTVN